MPFTLAHPAAVLPLRRCRYLQTVPLIIGSITPDLPYFLPGRIPLPARFTHALSETHTLVGSIVLCIPIGLAVLLCGYLLRRPLTALMSARARWLCQRAMDRFASRPLNWAAASLSILLGTWTHIAWDSFTHENGWITRRVAALRAPVSFGWYTGEICHVLQYVSSAIGLAVLAIWYARLPAPTPAVARTGPARPSDGLVVLLVLAAAIGIGGFQAAQSAGHSQSTYRMLYLLLTRIIAWFAVLYLVAGTLVMLNRRAEPELQS
jgi:hypothetical protein